MIYKIVAQIVAYSATQLMPVTCKEFGDTTELQPPYVVVKQEADSGGAGTAFRIISHFTPGMQKQLRAFNRTIIGQALDNFAATSDTGVYNQLSQDWDAFSGSTIIGNDDGTISLERLYYMGDRLK